MNTEIISLAVWQPHIPLIHIAFWGGYKTIGSFIFSFCASRRFLKESNHVLEPKLLENGNPNKYIMLPINQIITFKHIDILCHAFCL